MANFKISDILGIVTVKTSMIAIALMFIYIYLTRNELAGFNEIITALIVAAIVGYLITLEMDPNKELTHFISGALTYVGYAGAKIFLKITTALPNLQAVGTQALILGIVTVVVLQIYKRF